MSDESLDELNDEPTKPDFNIEQFLVWRNPRNGTANPERMTNPVWKWIQVNRLNGYAANQHFNGPDSMGAGPAWSADRFGQTSTRLDDGRKILIAGEHEDYYDPDFYIYNDLIVESPDGEFEFYGYDRDQFPPTDFHTATLVGDQIILIGNTGYPDSRVFESTQVLVLDLKTLEIAQKTTGGECPGWISRHVAKLSDDQQSITVTGGQVFPNEESPLLENFDTWRLDLRTWNWERLSQVNWQQWIIAREDGESNELWNIRSSLDRKAMGLSDDDILEHFPPEVRELMAEAITVDDSIDPKLLEALYSPPIQHKKVLREDTFENNDDDSDGDEIENDDDFDYNTYRIDVNGVMIRFTEEMSEVKMVVEGDLPEELIKQVVEDVCQKLGQIDNAKYQAKLYR